MPTKGKRDEKKWSRAKAAAAKSKGKKVSELKDDDYALVMSIYKKMKPDYFKESRTLFDCYLLTEAEISEGIMDWFRSSGKTAKTKLASLAKKGVLDNADVDSSGVIISKESKDRIPHGDFATAMLSAGRWDLDKAEKFVSKWSDSREAKMWLRNNSTIEQKKSRGKQKKLQNAIGQLKTLLAQADAKEKRIVQKAMEILPRIEGYDVKQALAKAELAIIQGA